MIPRFHRWRHVEKLRRPQWVSAPLERTEGFCKPVEFTEVVSDIEAPRFKVSEIEEVRLIHIFSYSHYRICRVKSIKR